MEQLARLASEIGNVSAVWVEDKPDRVEGYISSIKKHTNHRVELLIAKDHLEAEDLIEGREPSAVILDIKLEGSVDGITIAKRIRHRNKIIPIKFVTSYREEYARRLKELDNVIGVYDRLSLKDEVFQKFQSALTTELFSYKIYMHFDLHKMTWSEYLKHPYALALARAHSHLFTNVARAVMTTKNWNWLVFCGDRVIGGGKSLARFPSFEDKKRLARKHHAIPFVYSRPIVSEEGGGLGALLEHYPKAAMLVEGKKALANLDTGTNQTLISDSVTTPEPGSIPEKGMHLGKAFDYYVNKRSVTLHSVGMKQQPVGPISMPVAIVEDWKGSPWIRINPRRTGLIGRDIFAMESITVQIVSRGRRKGVSTRISQASEAEVPSPRTKGKKKPHRLPTKKIK